MASSKNEKSILSTIVISFMKKLISVLKDAFVFLFIILMIYLGIKSILEHLQPELHYSYSARNDLFALQKNLDKIPVDTNYYFTIIDNSVSAFDTTSDTLDLSGQELQNWQSFSMLSTTSEDNGVLHGEDNFYPIKQHVVTVKKLKKHSLNVPGLGNITFCANDTMLVDSPYRALLIIGQGVNMRFVNKIISQSFDLKAPAIKQDSMQLYDYTYASLNAAVASQFNILRSNPDTIQNTSNHKNQINIWEWTVTALNEGSNKLVLTLYSQNKSGQRLPNYHPSKFLTITVITVKKSWLKSLGEGVKDNWAFIVGGATLIGWLWDRSRKKKRSYLNKK